CRVSRPASTRSEHLPSPATIGAVRRLSIVSNGLRDAVKKSSLFLSRSRCQARAQPDTVCDSEPTNSVKLPVDSFFVKKSQVILRLVTEMMARMGELSEKQGRKSPRPLFEQHIFEWPISFEIRRDCTFIRGDRGCRKQLGMIGLRTP